MLYIVSTPIGNLKDLSLRAQSVLREVFLIACEDTRHSRILLAEYGITTPTTSYFQHNRFSKGAYLLELLKGGKDIALIADAGTPGILDPGYHLINLAIDAGIPVTTIPGPVALICALVLSGKPAHRFLFEGFLPVRQAARRNRLIALKGMDTTIVCYESCHRILKTLDDLAAVFPDRTVVLCRELTKKFEEVLRAKPQELSRLLRERSRPKGEFVLVI